MDKPAVWQMIKLAIEAMGGKGSYPDIKEYIAKHWGEVNQNTINAQIIVLTVNLPARINYPNNKKPRIANGPYDLLYSVASGQVVSYNPSEHGMWEIYQKEFGGLGVRQVITEDEEQEVVTANEDSPLLFPVEANLRDFLIENLHLVKDFRLKPYTDPETGRDGKEFPTDVGPIDILAEEESGGLVVFELKLSRGPDRALGQLQRYMGWVKAHVAKGRTVRGVIVANRMDTRIKYAVSVSKDISLYEYELKFELSQPAPIVINGAGG